MSGRDETKVYGAQRRFGLDVLLVLVTTCAALCAVLSRIGAPPGVWATTGVLLVAVSLAQVFLFGGQRPREASMVAGSALAAAFSLLAVVAFLATGRSGANPAMLLAVIAAPLAGAAAGYMLGGLVGGAFLICALLEKRRKRHGSGERRD